MSVQGLRSTREPSRLGIAFVTALVLHGAVLGGLTLWQSNETINPTGEQEITIDLAPAREEAESVAPAEISAVEAPLVAPDEVPLEPDTAEILPLGEAMEEQPEEVAVLSRPEDVAEVGPVEAETASEADPVVALPPPETVGAKTLEVKRVPKPENKSVQKPAERKPPPRQATAEKRSLPSNPHPGQASSSRENTGGVASSADPNVLNRYVAGLTAALRNRLRYPNVARSQGISGVATLRFTMDRSGRIVSSSLMRSAGHPALDQAALATASPGSSLPPAPAALPQQQFTITVPLRFNLR
jgi:protein TonB